MLTKVHVYDFVSNAHYFKTKDSLSYYRTFLTNSMSKSNSGLSLKSLQFDGGLLKIGVPWYCSFSLQSGCLEPTGLMPPEGLDKTPVSVRMRLSIRKLLRGSIISLYLASQNGVV